MVSDLQRAQHLQRELNRRMATRLEKLEFDYDAIQMRKREVEMAQLYRDAYLKWENVYDGQYQRFESAPVSEAYWGFSYPAGPYIWRGKIKKKKPVPIEIVRYYHNKLLNPPVTITFKRFRNLLPEIMNDYFKQDILVQVFLGFENTLGYKFTYGEGAILNDAWEVNLVCREKDNILMESFLKGSMKVLKKK